MCHAVWRLTGIIILKRKLAWVGKAHLDACRHSGAQQALGARGRPRGGGSGGLGHVKAADRLDRHGQVLLRGARLAPRPGCERAEAGFSIVLMGCSVGDLQVLHEIVRDALIDHS